MADAVGFRSGKETSHCRVGDPRDTSPRLRPQRGSSTGDSESRNGWRLTPLSNACLSPHGWPTGSGSIFYSDAEFHDNGSQCHGARRRSSGRYAMKPKVCRTDILVRPAKPTDKDV